MIGAGLIKFCLNVVPIIEVLLGEVRLWEIGLIDVLIVEVYLIKF